MIHFGVSQRATSFRIERFAHNRAALRRDAEGVLPSRPVIKPEGPARFDTDLPAADLAAHLDSCGLPAVASRSAGSYLCNYLYYHSLDWAGRQSDRRLALFVHVPPHAGQGGSVGKTDLLRGAHEIVRFVVAYAETRAPVTTPTGPAFARNEVVVEREGCVSDGRRSPASVAGRIGTWPRRHGRTARGFGRRRYGSCRKPSAPTASCRPAARSTRRRRCNLPPIRPPRAARRCFFPPASIRPAASR